MPGNFVGAHLVQPHWAFPFPMSLSLKLLHTNRDLFGCCNFGSITLQGHIDYGCQFIDFRLEIQLCNRSLLHTTRGLFGCCKLGSIALQGRIDCGCQLIHSHLENIAMQQEPIAYHQKFTWVLYIRVYNFTGPYRLQMPINRFRF